MLIACVLTWHHVDSFIRRLTILPVCPMYTCPQEQVYFVHSYGAGGLWFLRFLKICPIFLNGLKIGYCVCLISCQSDLLFLWHTGEWIGFRLIVCVRNRYLVCMFIDCFDYVLSCPFFCKTIFKWLDSVCRCSLSEMVKDLCTSELIADCFCAGWWCDSACIYLCVLVFCTLDDLRYCQLS